MGKGRVFMGLVGLNLGPRAAAEFTRTGAMESMLEPQNVPPQKAEVTSSISR